MKILLTACVPILASCAATMGPPQPAFVESTNHLAAVFGEREFDDGDYEPVDEHDAYGAVFSVAPTTGGLGGEFGFYTSDDDDDVAGIDVELESQEIFGGVRYTFGSDHLRPYLSAGVSWIELDLDAEAGGFGVSDDDDGFGLYLAAGVNAWLTRRFTVGVEYRVLLGSDLELFGVDTDADYDQIALSVGFGF